MEKLDYVTAAYGVIWLITAFYLFILLKRNRTLTGQIDHLESRLQALEESGTEPNNSQEQQL